MIQSQIVLHRFEAVMRRAGWSAPAPRGTDAFGAGWDPHLERYAGALRVPMGLQD